MRAAVGNVCSSPSHRCSTFSPSTRPLVIAYNMCFRALLGRLRIDPDGGRLRTQLGFIQEGFAPPAGVLLSRLHPGHRVCHGRARPRGGALLGTLSNADRPPRPGVPLRRTERGQTLRPLRCAAGVLPRMLQEILDTRVMVKTAAARPDVSAEPVMQRIMNARQLTLEIDRQRHLWVHRRGLSRGACPARSSPPTPSSLRAAATLQRAVRPW